YELPYPQPDTRNGVPYGIPDDTLANENVTESVGGDDLAAFDVGTISIATAATSATKPRRFRDMCGLLRRNLPWLPAMTPWRRRLREDGRGRPPSIVCAPRHIGRATRR